MSTPILIQSGLLGSDEEETQPSYGNDQHASDDDAATAETDVPNRHIRTKALTTIEEERLASLMSQVKLEEEKLASLKDEIKRQEQTRVAVEEEMRRLKQENSRTVAEAAHMEEQRETLKQENARMITEAAHMEKQHVLNETQNRLEEQARAESERAKQAEEIRRINARLQEAEAARIEADKELRDLIKRTKEDQEKAAREQVDTAREDTATWRQRQELEDARIRASLQQQEEQLRYQPTERVEYNRTAANLKDHRDTETNYAQEEDEDRMVARMGRELGMLLGDMDPDDERNMVEAEARQKAQAAAYQEQMAMYTKQTSEPAKQRARLQYAYDLVAEARARFDQDPLKTAQQAPPHAPQGDGYASRNVRPVPAWFQQAPATYTAEPHSHIAQPPASVLSRDSLQHTYQQVPAPIRLEGAGFPAQDYLPMSNYQQALPSARQQRGRSSQEHQDIASGYSQGLATQADTASARHLEPLATEQPKQALAPSHVRGLAPTHQSPSAWASQEQVQPLSGYVSMQAAQTISAHAPQPISAHAPQTISAHAAQRTSAPVHSISSAQQDLRGSTPSPASDLSVFATLIYCSTV